MPLEKVGHIEPNMENIERTLDEFENELVNFDREVAVVITKDGDIFRFNGGINNVNPDLLGESRKGASDFHNHPKNETNYSFSVLDAGHFWENEMAISRSGDYMYRYSMRRTNDTVKATQAEIITEFKKVRNAEVWKLAYYEKIDMDIDGYHEIILRLADKYKFKYERTKRNDS